LVRFHQAADSIAQQKSPVRSAICKCDSRALPASISERRKIPDKSPTAGGVSKITVPLGKMWSSYLPVSIPSSRSNSAS
jgi:hypothetical protein